MTLQRLFHKLSLLAVLSLALGSPPATRWKALAKMPQQPAAR
jgi:hypothetical protein